MINKWKKSLFKKFQQKTVVNNTKICILCKLNINNSTKNVNALVNEIQSWTNVKASSKMVWRSIPISNTIAPLGATLASGAGTRCLSGSACCHSVNLCTHVGREHARVMVSWKEVHACPMSHSHCLLSSNRNRPFLVVLVFQGSPSVSEDDVVSRSFCNIPWSHMVPDRSTFP